MMIIDCHVHVCAMTPGHGSASELLMRRWSIRFIRWRLGLTPENGEPLERDVEAKLVETVNGTPELDAAVVLAFDAVYQPDGQPDPANTHLYVTNDYAAEL